MLKSEGSAELALPFTGPEWDCWSCFLLYQEKILMGGLAPTPGRDGPTQHHWQGSAGPDDMGVEDMALLLLKRIKNMKFYIE